MSQTSYQIYTDQAYAGQVFDLNDNMVILSFNNPNNSIYYGRGVVKVSGQANGVDVPTANTNTILGIAVRDLTQASAGFYPVNSAVAVMRTGLVWVEVSESVTPDDAPLMNVDTDSGQVVGVFGKTANGVHKMAVVGARFVLVNSITDKYGVKLALMECLFS